MFARSYGAELQFKPNFGLAVLHTKPDMLDLQDHRQTVCTSFAAKTLPSRSLSLSPSFAPSFFLAVFLEIPSWIPRLTG